MPENIDGLLADFGMDPNAGAPETNEATQPQTDDVAEATNESVETVENYVES